MRVKRMYAAQAPVLAQYAHMAAQSRSRAGVHLQTCYRSCKSSHTSRIRLHHPTLDQLLRTRVPMYAYEVRRPGCAIQSIAVDVSHALGAYHAPEPKVLCQRHGCSAASDANGLWENGSARSYTDSMTLDFPSTEYSPFQYRRAPLYMPR
ncbi:hypothetical protein EIQ02_06915 [Xanthomonas campestris pv. raphani]